MFDRRKVITTAFMVPVGLVMANCSTVTPDKISQIIEDVHIIAAGVASALAGIGAVKGIPTNVISMVTKVLGDLASIAAQISSASSDKSKTLVEKLAAGVSSIVTVITSYQIPDSMKTVLNAAMVLLPILEKAVGLILPMIPHAGNPDQARLVLKAAMAQ